NQSACPRPRTVNPATSPPAEHLLWHHAAFCRMALPVQAPSSDWSRDVGTAAIRIAASPGPPGTPRGRFIRLVLMHVCDVTFCAGSQALDRGESAASLATTRGVEMCSPVLDEHANEVDLLAKAQITASVDGRQPIAVFDVGSNSHGATKWHRHN